jgi:two-component system, cell cycle sensor histidine kinase and response regulator CckA
MALKSKKPSNKNRFLKNKHTGKPVGIPLVKRDIAGRKRVEEALRESEEKYRSLVDGANEAILVVQDGLVKFVNLRAVEVAGYSGPDILDKPFPEFVYPDDRAMVVDNYTKRMKGEPAPARYEFRLLAVDGSATWVEINTVQIDWDGKPASLIFLTDITERKQAEQKLRESEEKYRSLVDGADEGILVAQDGKLKFVNHRLAEFSGYSESELLAKPFPEFIHPDDRGMVVDNFVKRMKGESAPSRYEFRMLTADGSAKWVEITIAGIEWNHRPAVLSFLADITERKQAEQKLRESEEKFSKIFKTSPDSVTITRLSDGTYLEINQNFTDTTGFTPEEVLGRSSLPGGVALWTTAEDRDRMVAGLRAHGEVIGMEAPLRMKNGAIRTALLSARILEINGEKCILTIARDITERKLAEEALRESEGKYRSLVDGANEAILVAQDGMLKFVNHKAAELSGHPEPVLLAKPFPEFIHPDDRAMVVNNYVKRLKGEPVPSMYEFRLLSVDNSAKWVEINTVVIDWQGKPATLNFLTDISGRKCLEKEKEKLQSQLLQVQKMEAVGTLAGGVAHDFNNILTAISGYATLAMGNIDESNPAHRDLKQISLAAAKAAGVVRQLLLFSRKGHMEQVPMDPNAAIIRMLKMLDRIIGEDIVIETRLEKELWSILGDEGNIEQVLMNLAVNAKDAMPRGGKLSIKTENVTIDKEFCRKFNEARPGRFVCLSISDTGTGMDELTKEHIFEPFFTTKEVGKGTGLGLSVVLGIVQQHRGWINVNSEPKHGATFNVYFPAISAKSEQQSKKESPLAPLQGKGERILVVEDHADVREIAKQMLEVNGYSVFPVSTAQEATELFEKENGNIDLVFCDVILPDSVGTQLVEELMKRWKFGVILTSGYTDEKAHWDFIKENKYLFLHKPYTMHALLQAVKDVLEENKS